MQPAPHQFWQEILPAGSLAAGLLPGESGHAAELPDGRLILLPIRILPPAAPDTVREKPRERAVASLIINQASFAVLDALADALTAALMRHRPEVVIAVPTLGLTLGEAVGRRLGHQRLVPLGTSRKFWYDDTLSEPMRSITTPGQEKRIYLDPRMLSLLQGRRIALVDDVISTGSSMRSVLRLLHAAGLWPEVIGTAMLQGGGWRQLFDGLPVGCAPCAIETAIATPIFERDPAGRLLPVPPAKAI